MKKAIEITIQLVEGGRILTNVKGKNCTNADVLGMMTEVLCSMAASAMNVPEADRAQCADEFGQMMKCMLLDTMNSPGSLQRFEGKEAKFMTELLTRQGEVQEG